MKILVTGGCGFIGSHIVDQLIDENHQVLVVDNLSTGSREHLNSRAKLVMQDITEAGLLPIFQHFQPEVVIHEAAQIDVKISVEEPDFDAYVNVVGTVKVLECCRKTGVRKVIYASSAAIYGDPLRLPVDEEHPKNALSFYGISKRIPEDYIKVYHDLCGLDYTILRYANVYGERQNAHGEGGVVAIFSKRLQNGAPIRIFGDGEQIRDFVYVRDIAKANILAIAAGDGETMNVAREEATAVNQLLSAMEEAFGKKAQAVYREPARDCDIVHSYLDHQRMREVFGWTPEFSLQEGLRSMAESLESK